MFGFFNIFFFTLLFFCAYVAFSQWRITKDRSIPWYIGYLAGTFLHYGRQFLLDISAAHIMPDPPLEWDTPLSYAAFACYFLFVREVMEVHRSAPVLSRVIVGMAFLLILSAGAIWYFWPSAPQEQPIETQRAPKPTEPPEPIADQAPITPPEPPKTPESAHVQPQTGRPGRCMDRHAPAVVRPAVRNSNGRRG